MDLFNFDFKPNHHVDKYAGLGNYEKYRKINTKANVDMIIDRFSPFSAAKRRKEPISTLISLDNTNIDNTPLEGVVLTSLENSKKRKIVINNEILTKNMELIKPEKQEEYIESSIRYAYGTFNNLAKAGAFVGSYMPRYEKKEITEEYLNLVELVHNLARAKTGNYCVDLPSMITDFKLESTSSLELNNIAKDLLSGSEVTEAAKIINSSNNSTADFYKIEDAISEAIGSDVSLGGGVVSDTDFEKHELVPKYKKYVRGEKQPDEDGFAKEASSVGNGQVNYDDTPKFSEHPTAKDKEFYMNNDTMETDGIDSSSEAAFFDVKSRRTTGREFDKYNHLIDALYESLSGRLGKNSSQNPAKKLNKRNVASDISDNIYVTSSPIGGKHLNINLIIDTSGSMSGHYIDDAVYITYVFNELARRGVVKGNIMLSANGISGMWQMPMSKDRLKIIYAHNGGEGFKHTFAIRWKQMLEADFNIAITDGCLTDGHIDLSDMEASNIFVTGLYVKRGMDKKRILSYTGQLNKWFSYSIVRPSVEDAIYSIVDSAILHLGEGVKR